MFTKKLYSTKKHGRFYIYIFYKYNKKVEFGFQIAFKMITQMYFINSLALKFYSLR